MILSKRCLHGLRAVLYLASQPPGRKNVPIGEIAAELKIPFHFLTKILRELGAKGIVVASRGAAGGLRLGIPPEQFTVKDVIDNIGGESLFSGCILGFSRCNEERPCALHHRWSVVKEQVGEMLDGETIRDVVERIHARDLRLLEDTPLLFPAK
jgi:Rrf2 family iron-sulfur cluster assembly transcriptional regulator